jgi:hypothetical protein
MKGISLKEIKRSSEYDFRCKDGDRERKQNMEIEGIAMSWVLVAHTCDPSFSGGSNQEDLSLKPAQGK